MLDDTIRAIVREVVRDEIRAAFHERSSVEARRNAGQDAGAGYLSIARAAAFADVAPGTLRRWIRLGRLPARRAGRVYRVARADLERLLAHLAPNEVAERAERLLHGDAPPEVRA